MCIRRNLPALTCLCALLSLASSVNALTMERASLRALSKSSGTILVGEVVDAYSYWNADGTWIYTDFRIAPAEVLKGKVKGPELTITMLGGSDGHTTVVVPGGPSLELGKSYVLFVQQVDLPGAPKSQTLTGYTQSVFDIVPAKHGLQAISQARHMHLTPDASGKTEAAGGSEGILLDDLKATIRLILAAAAWK